MPVTLLRTKDGQVDDNDVPALAALRCRLSAGSTKIILHLHGGLVAQKSGEEAAVRLSGNGDHSFNAPDDYEQVYVIWRTGAIETMRTNWRDLFENDRLYRALFKRLIGYIDSKMRDTDSSGRSVSPFAWLSQAEIENRLRNGGDAPFADLDELAKESPAGRSVQSDIATDAKIGDELSTILHSDHDFVAAINDLAAAMSSDDNGRAMTQAGGDEVLGRQSLNRLNKSVQSKLNEVKASDDKNAREVFTGALLLKEMIRHAIQIALRIIRRFRENRDHGVHATIVEELVRELYGDLIGASIWGMMKKDAGDHFAPGGLGSALVDILSSGKHSLLVTAHSAGSIWAANLLKAANGNLLYKFDLVFMAPAIRMREFAAVLDVANQLIGRFRMFTMKDELERADPVLGKGYGMIYPSSLLYLISGLLEEEKGRAYPDAPLVGMQRFHRNVLDWLQDPEEIRAARMVNDYLAQADLTVYSINNNGHGLSTDATSHGEFDDNKLTLSSVGALFL